MLTNHELAVEFDHADTLERVEFLIGQIQDTVQAEHEMNEPADVERGFGCRHHPPDIRMALERMMVALRRVGALSTEHASRVSECAAQGPR